MKTYLSIDLDFWNQGKRSLPHLKRFLTTVRHNLPMSRIKVVDSHEELLPHVNESGCDELINIDWHSDVTNRFDSCEYNLRSPTKLNCGTWVSFVKFRKQGVYTWIHPYKASDRIAKGYCHWPLKNIHNPFVNPCLAGWNATRQLKNKHPEKVIPWNSVTHAGICFSYDWVAEEIKGPLYEVAQKVLGFRPKPNPRAKLY